MANKYLSAPAKTLATDLSAASALIKFTDIKDWGGVNDLTTASFPSDYIPATLINDDGTRLEFILITASTIASAITTGATIYKRGLPYFATGDLTTDQTEVTANKLEWTQGETKVLFGSHQPYLFGRFANKDNEELINNIWSFKNAYRPQLVSDTDATADEQLVTQGQLNRTALGTTLTNRVIIAGTAGATVAAGNLVYLDTSDQEWKLADASTSATSEQVKLGIAQGAGTDGNSISGGVLLEGYDNNQSGLTVGIQFLSDTAGAISTSEGTVTRAVGEGISATEIIFDPYFYHTIKEVDKDKLEAITSSANELNTLDGYTGDVNDFNEMEAFFGATDISGAEAEQLTDGSNADSLHIHSSAGSQLIPGVHTDRDFACVVGNGDGSVLVSLFNQAPASGGAVTLIRYAKDTSTGEYYQTHSAAGQAIANAGAIGAYLFILGDYVYEVYEVSTSVLGVYRYDLADLTNGAAITISGGTLVPSDYNLAFSDGTDVYIQRDALGGDFNKYTISGTTITFDSIITYGTELSDNERSVCFADSTNVWSWNQSNQLTKWTISSGTEVSQTTYGPLGIGNKGFASPPASTGVIGLIYRSAGTFFAAGAVKQFNATTSIDGRIELKPFVKS